MALKFFRRHHTWTDIDDIRQEVRIARWQAEEKWVKEKGAGLSYHVRLSVHRHLIDYARSNGPFKCRSTTRRYDNSTDFDPILHDRGHTVDYASIIDAKDQFRALPKSLQRITLLYLAGWTYKEIAEAELVSENAISQKLDFRYRKEKRKSLRSQPSDTQIKKAEKLSEFQWKLSKRIESTLSQDLMPGISLTP